MGIHWEYMGILGIHWEYMGIRGNTRIPRHLGIHGNTVWERPGVGQVGLLFCPQFIMLYKYILDRIQFIQSGQKTST